MATGTATNEALQTLPEELHPKVDHLVTENDTPVDNIFHEKQQRLLVEPLYSSWGGVGASGQFVAMANVGLFYGVRQPPYVPDMLLSLDVQVPADLFPKANRSYFIWEYGKPPEVVVEVVSNREGGEDSVKRVGYARLGIPYYVIFDPDNLLSNQSLYAFRLEGMQYQPLEEPIWLPGVELGLCLWQGRFENHENIWLRWVDDQNRLILTGAERVEEQRQQLQLERQRAEQERQRAERLAEQLRRLGAEPEA